MLDVATICARVGEASEAGRGETNVVSFSQR